jgi:hypothetical protein
MEIPGRVKNGVVVLEGGPVLPEGTPVIVLARASPVIHVAKKKRRVVLPLVPSKRPGTLRLTAERIAEILEEEELSGLPTL